jgi:hypothetical protein
MSFPKSIVSPDSGQLWPNKRVVGELGNCRFSSSFGTLGGSKEWFLAKTQNQKMYKRRAITPIMSGFEDRKLNMGQYGAGVNGEMNTGGGAVGSYNVKCGVFCGSLLFATQYFGWLLR